MHISEQMGKLPIVLRVALRFGNPVPNSGQPNISTFLLRRLWSRTLPGTSAQPLGSMFSSGAKVARASGKITSVHDCYSAAEGGAARDVVSRDEALFVSKTANTKAKIGGSFFNLKYSRTQSASQRCREEDDLDGDIGAEDLQLLMQAAADPHTGVSQKDRWWMFTLYAHCWVASQMVAWLVDEGHCYDEEEAVERCEEARRKGFIKHVVDARKKFKNEKLFYRFTTKVFENLDPLVGAEESSASAEGVDGEDLEEVGGSRAVGTRTRVDTSVALETGRDRGEIVLDPPISMELSESTLAGCGSDDMDASVNSPVHPANHRIPKTDVALDKVGEGIGSVEESSNGSTATEGKPTANDFTFVRVVGEGSYAQVWLVRFKATNEEFAIKKLDKQHIVKEKKVHEVNREKEILEMVEHPFIIRLHGTFQDLSSLYFVLEYCPNKTVLEHIHMLGSLSLRCATWYLAELVLAVEYLQSLDILHRDIKPENMLLDKHNHLKLVDFGTATRLGGKRERKGRASSFVGTAEYVAPELLKKHYSNKSSDIWALGCVAYQFIAGEVPFRGNSDFLTFEKIAAGKIEFPILFPDVARDLVKALLVADDTKRLGAGEGGFAALKSHAFFVDMDWEAIPGATPPTLEPPAEPVIPKAFKRKEDLIKDTKDSKWNIFLLSGSPPELILREGLIHKRKHRVSRPKKRQLILTDFPRLLYVDPDAMCLKGEVEWTHKLGVELKSTSHFSLSTAHRRYHFEDLDKNASRWCEAIEQVQNDKGIPEYRKSNSRLWASSSTKKGDSAIKRSPKQRSERKKSKSPKREAKSPRKSGRGPRSISAKKSDAGDLPS